MNTIEPGSPEIRKKKSDSLWTSSPSVEGLDSGFRDEVTVQDSRFKVRGVGNSLFLPPSHRLVLTKRRQFGCVSYVHELVKTYLCDSDIRLAHANRSHALIPDTECSKQLKKTYFGSYTYLDDVVAHTQKPLARTPHFDFDYLYRIKLHAYLFRV